MSTPQDRQPRVAKRAPVVAAVGDVHGHLQLALCVVALWQKQLALDLEAVLLCGDVGTFTAEGQLDNATRRHAKANPCELEFLYQWSATPQPRWLDYIFEPEAEGGLGLLCPVVMVHGNHEGFAHLASLAPNSLPGDVVPVQDLPAVDTGGRIRFLPSGWRARTASGLVIAGIGGIETGQRHARYHPMAYVDDAAVLHLLEKAKVDVLVTHQGPSAIQGETGSPTLEHLLDVELARVWFHGHATPIADPVWAGPAKGTLVVPLGDVAFPSRGSQTDEPGREGWCLSTIAKDEVTVRKETPPFLRDFRRKRWTETSDGLLVCPPLAAHVQPGLRGRR
jgi:hypothetical protein